MECLKSSLGIDIAYGAGSVAVTESASAQARDESGFRALASLLGAQMEEREAIARESGTSLLNGDLSIDGYTPLPADLTLTTGFREYGELTAQDSRNPLFKAEDRLKEHLNRVLATFDLARESEVEESLATGYSVRSFDRSNAAARQLIFDSLDHQGWDAGREANYPTYTFGLFTGTRPSGIRVESSGMVYPEGDPFWEPGMRPYIEHLGPELIAPIATIPTDTGPHSHPAPLVPTLFLGEPAKGPFKARGGLGDAERQWYEETIRHTTVALASGDLRFSLTDPESGSVDSLSQVVAAWANHVGRNVLMPISPIFENLQSIEKQASPQGISNLGDLFGPTSPWWVTRVGDSSFAIGARLDFLELPMNLAYGPIVAAVRAATVDVQAAWRRRDPTLGREGLFVGASRYVFPARVLRAFCRALRPEFDLFPLRSLGDATYYGMQLADLPDAVLPFLAWDADPYGRPDPLAERPKDLSLAFSNRYQGRFETSTVPVEVWRNALCDSYPRPFSLAGSQADNWNRLRDTCVIASPRKERSMGRVPVYRLDTSYRADADPSPKRPDPKEYTCYISLDP